MPNIQKPNQHFDVVTYTGNGKAVATAGNAQMSTAQSKFGGTSLFLDGTGDYLTFGGETDFAFGTGDFTIEFWARSAVTISANTFLIDFRPTSTEGAYPSIVINSSGKLLYQSNSATLITGTTTISANTWYHVALTRSGTSTKLFVNGNQEGSTYTDTINYLVGASRPVIGSAGTVLATAQLNGYIDDLRVYKGAGKYTANFTTPTGALAIGPTDSYWQYCVAALPFDGTNGSNSIPCINYKPEVENGLNFEPALIWLKARSSGAVGYDHNLYDSVRGISSISNPTFSTSTTAAQITYPGFGPIQTTPNGFVLGGGASLSNFNAATYVAWCWKAGDSTVTNTAGTITSQVRANTTSGFSIVNYTGNGVAGATVGHGLNATPKFVIIKNYGATTSWIVFSHITTQITGSALTSSVINLGNKSGGALNLNLTAASASYTMDSQANASSNTYIGYCWSEIPGLSSFGSYTGNGNADGPFVNLGFRPALVIIKMSNSTGNWIMVDDKRDGYNVDNDPLWANLTTAEGTTDLLDLTSNGFKIRSTDASVNTNAGTYVYAAWAEFPSKYSLSR